MSAGSDQTLATTFTPADSTDFTTVTAYAHIDVNPLPSSPPLVTVSSAHVKTVRPPKHKSATDVIISLSGDLNATNAGIVGNYHLAAPGKGKKSKTYSKNIVLKSAAFNSTSDR